MSKFFEGSIPIIWNGKRMGRGPPDMSIVSGNSDCCLDGLHDIAQITGRDFGWP